MAIYSASHSSIGRKTHAAGTAGAHAKYILREKAVGGVAGEHMPSNSNEARAWLDAQEEADRKNARVIDKVRVALPLELSAEQRIDLVRAFAAEIGRGRIAWVAAVHDRGEDEHNPHAHVIFRDRDIETGKRVAELSEKGSTERIRETWERVANAALEQAGRDERIDRRSLKDQGIDREAGIHVGPAAFALHEKGERPESQPRMVTMTGGNTRVVHYPGIDAGRTRAERQAEIQAENRRAATPEAPAKAAETPQEQRADAQAKTVAPAPSQAPPGPSYVITDPLRGSNTKIPRPEPTAEAPTQGTRFGGTDPQPKTPEAPPRASNAVENSSLGSQGVEIDKKPAQDLKQVFQQVENPIPIPTPAPKAPERAEIDRPAPRLYDRVLSVAAEIRDRFFAFFKSDDSTRPAPSKPTPPASSMDRSQGGATSSPDPAPQYQPPPPPRDQQLDDLRAMQQRDSQQRQRERMSAAELQAMLDRQQRHGQEHGPER